jgi:hypothetical protein
MDEFRISNLVAMLEKIRQERGDLEVYTHNDDDEFPMGPNDIYVLPPEPERVRGIFGNWTEPAKPERVNL